MRPITLLFAFAVLAACGPAPESASSGEHPTAEARDWTPPRNVLLITLDTTRADFLSCLGGDPRNTPHLDALAARSALFTQATSETNVTNPSHLTIMTGLRAIEHGVHGNTARIPEDLATLPITLGRAGFDTGGFVAAKHLARDAGWLGFDSFPEVRGVLDAPTVTKRALRWLRGRTEAPFFLWVHYFDAHALYNPPPEIAREFYAGDREAGEGELLNRHPFFEQAGATRSWLGKTRDPDWPRAMYAAELHYLDQSVGRLLEELASLGHADDTLVVVVADHGESLGEHEIFYDHKGIWEPSLRIPLIVHTPGAPASRIDLPVSTLDVAPTIADLLGRELEHSASGLSLVPLLAGRPDEELESRQLFIHQNAHNAVVGVRDGPWKLIWPIDQDHALLAGPPQLFNLDDDPGELVDLSAREPERLEQLRAKAAPWLELGPVQGGDTSHLDESARAQLRALGYTDG